MTRFRELRLQKGWTQKQLCNLFNKKYNRKYTISAMYLIEHDKRSPELGALLDFADFYGVSLDYLLGRDLAGKTAYDFVEDKYTRSWQLSEQLRNMILGLYTMQEDKTEDLVANGHEVALAELKEMDAMGEVEENIVMLQSLLKVSRILARRVEKKSKNWYKY